VLDSPSAPWPAPTPQLAQSSALVTTYQIALFKALAGGWTNEG
jgi:hypothetical protein